MNVLFLCTSNIQRSRTADDYFSETNKLHCYKSAGLNEVYCRYYGSRYCSEELLQWADVVYVFESTHINRIVDMTGDKYTDKIINLEIEDRYRYMDSALLELLNQKLSGRL